MEKPSSLKGWEAERIEPRRILIADDHPLFREAMKQALGGVLTATLFDEAGNLDETIVRLESSDAVDLVLLDLKMPGAQGLSGLIYLRAQYPILPVAVVSANDDPHVIHRAVDLGAAGFIPKSTPIETIRMALDCIMRGEVWIPDAAHVATPGDEEADRVAHRIATLTPQQLRVLMMLREGLLNKQIAFALDVSEATIKAHVSAILLKLDVDSRTQAVIAASRIDGDPTAALA
jgi:DNA-binding NarL/FixJ family response regulator